MITYKIKSGIFLFAFVFAATAYHLYEKDQVSIQPAPSQHTVVDLQTEDMDNPAVTDQDRGADQQ